MHVWPSPTRPRSQEKEVAAPPVAAVQLAFAPQEPQEGVLLVPQLSASVGVPQVSEAAAQRAPSLSAVQPQAFATPPPPQVTPVPEQLPQETVREAPQLSEAVSAPQFAPFAAQRLADDSGVQPQTFAVPAPPQETPVPEQVPHCTVRETPQLSDAAKYSQDAPSEVHSA